MASCKVSTPAAARVNAEEALHPPAPPIPAKPKKKVFDPFFTDRLTARDYGKNLLENLTNLVEMVKAESYRSKWVLRKYIPKLNGKMRPLGIPAIADKVLQMAVTKLLEAIYEAEFLPCSYGYRPPRGALDAVRDVSRTLRKGEYHFVVEADIQGFFDHIDHEKLLAILAERIDDRPFLGLIQRWLKTGILEPDGRVILPEAG